MINLIKVLWAIRKLIPYYVIRLVFSSEAYCSSCAKFIRMDTVSGVCVTRELLCKNKGLCIRWKRRGVQNETERILNKDW